MKALIKTSTLASLLFKRTSTPAINAIRNHWNKDFEPGPYPLTEEERIAAAHKYGIPIQEYAPYPDDGYGSGDYPKLPNMGAETRDSFYPWDNPELKRNHEEILHENFDLMTEDRFDPNKKFHRPIWWLWLQSLGVMGTLWIMLVVSNKVAKQFLSVMPPQIPKEGKVYYTFEAP